MIREWAQHYLEMADPDEPVDPDDVAEMIRDYYTARKNTGIHILDDMGESRYLEAGSCANIELKFGLEYARMMKGIEDEHVTMMGKIDEMAYYSYMPDVKRLIIDHFNGDYEEGVDQYGEFCDDFYWQRICDIYNDRFPKGTIGPDCLTEVSKGEVGKVLWRMLKAWVRMKSIAN